MRCSFVPPWLLAHVAETVHGVLPDPAAARCEETLRRDATFRRQREAGAGAEPPRLPTAWTVHTADHQEHLPGRPVRSAGEPATGDAAVDEAADGIEVALGFLDEVLDRQSYDDAGASASLTVHYGDRYANAFWDGRQLVFGDGDGVVFERLTKSFDVLGHELAHAVTEHTAGLVYRDQPGALNESFSDVLAACMEQRRAGETAAEAGWLIGEGLFKPGVHARALRDMRHPGTAYDDPRLGRDPQPDHMDRYVAASDDNGGVHLNSGIPNRAFVLAATAIGGQAWERPLAIWWAAMTDTRVTPTATFREFAEVTVAVAGDEADAVRAAWQGVGVLAGAGSGEDGSGPQSAAEDPELPDVVEVCRSGGLLGRTETGRVDLRTEDPRAGLVAELVTRVDFSAFTGGGGQPDRFVYTFRLSGHEVRVGEHELTGELRRLARVVLGDE